MAKNMASASDRAGRTCLHLAAANSHLKVCQYLLTSSLTRNGVQDVDKKGRTPLHYAALAGSVDIVALLIEKGADANAQVIYSLSMDWHYSCLTIYKSADFFGHDIQVLPTPLKIDEL